MSNTRWKKIADIFVLVLFPSIFIFIGCKSKSKDNPSAPAGTELNSTQWITNGTSPSVSPDGTKLLFKRDGLWYLHNQAGTDEQVFSSLNPSSVIRWFPDSRFAVFSISGSLGSDTDGVYLYTAASDSLERIHPSGRDPVPWTRGTSSDSIIFEETNPLVGTGLYTYALSSGTISRVGSGLIGSNVATSPDGNSIAYLSGSFGVTPCVAHASDNWAEHFIGQIDAYHLCFVSNIQICFDKYEDANNTTGSAAIYLYSTLTLADTIWLNNAGHPVVATSGAMAYQATYMNSSQLMLIRNQTNYVISDNISSYCITADGKVVYEKAGNIWISD